MTNPYLTDAIDRILRDLPRKLSWNDRVIGTMRLALSEGVTPNRVVLGAKWATKALIGDKSNDAIKKELETLWETEWSSEHDELLTLILSS